MPNGLESVQSLATAKNNSIMAPVTRSRANTQQSAATKTTAGAAAGKPKKARISKKSQAAAPKINPAKVAKKPKARSKKKPAKPKAKEQNPPLSSRKTLANSRAACEEQDNEDRELAEILRILTYPDLIPSPRKAPKATKSNDETSFPAGRPASTSHPVAKPARVSGQQARKGRRPSSVVRSIVEQVGTAEPRIPASSSKERQVSVNNAQVFKRPTVATLRSERSQAHDELGGWVVKLKNALEIVDRVVAEAEDRMRILAAVNRMQAPLRRAPLGRERRRVRMG